MKQLDNEFIRDNNNDGAVLNTDNSALSAYKMRKKKNHELELMKEKVNQIDSIKSEIKEIKNMLQLIAERIK